MLGEAMGESAARLLLTGPGKVRPLAARVAVYVLAVAGVVALAWSGITHLRLWADGYAQIPSIGPLFLAQGIATLAIAAVLLVFRRVVVMVAGAVALAATAIGLLLSAHGGLFGYTESLAVPYARSSLVVEFGGAAVLLVAAVTLAVVGQLGREPGR
jgi:hypothetical protein